MSQYIAAGFLNAIMPVNILAMLLSVTIGIIIGALPGLSAACHRSSVQTYNPDWL